MNATIVGTRTYVAEDASDLDAFLNVFCATKRVLDIKLASSAVMDESNGRVQSRLCALVMYGNMDSEASMPEENILVQQEAKT